MALAHSAHRVSDNINGAARWRGGLALSGEIMPTSYGGGAAAWKSIRQAAQHHRVYLARYGAVWKNQKAKNAGVSRLLRGGGALAASKLEKKR